MNRRGFLSALGAGFAAFAVTTKLGLTEIRPIDEQDLSEEALERMLVELVEDDIYGRMQTIFIPHFIITDDPHMQVQWSASEDPAKWWNEKYQQRLDHTFLPSRLHEADQHVLRDRAYGDGVALMATGHPIA